MPLFLIIIQQKKGSDSWGRRMFYHYYVFLGNRSTIIKQNLSLLHQNKPR